jgi:hypothetical protein
MNFPYPVKPDGGFAGATFSRDLEGFFIRRVLYISLKISDSGKEAVR